MIRFTKDDAGLLDKAPRYRKKTLTPMFRVDEPFEVETREGVLTCQDGYIARDAHGWLYPIASDEQQAIYELATEEQSMKHALGHAMAMEEWQERHGKKVPDLPGAKAERE